MKITKTHLRRIIKEELQSTLKEAVEKDPSDAEEGDYLSIRVGDYADDTLVKVFDSPPEIGYKGSYTNLVCIAKIIKIAERDPEDY